jgi:3-hydroxyisobutyrate dehydrogenase-like beta-hydroxyacid dehydrogenase
LKDVRLALAAAEAVATPMPLASLIHDHFLSAIAHGQGEMDWTGLAPVIAENAGLGEPKAMQRSIVH